MADSGERTSSFSHDPLVCNCMLLDYCLLDALKREINTLCSIYGLRSVCKQLKQSVKEPEFHPIASSRFLLSATSESTGLLMPSSDAIATRKPTSDFDWLIV